MSPSVDRGRVAHLCRRLLVIALVCSMLVTAVAPATAFLRGEPDISVTLSDGTIQPGAETAIDLTLVNSGNVDFGADSQLNTGKEQVVTTARGTLVRVESANEQSPVEVESGEVGVGSVPQGARSVPIRISVPEDAEPGTYELDVEVDYDYYSQLSGGQTNGYNSEDVTKEYTVEVTVEEAARFEVVSATTDAPVGSSGTVDLTVANVGTETASDATLTLESRNAALNFDGSPTAEAPVGDLAPGERRTVSVGADVAPGVTPRSLSLAGTLAYDDEDGDRQQSSVSADVIPRSAQQFAATDAETTAAVDDTGQLTVALVNDGNRTLEDATVQFESGNAALTFGGSPTARAFVGTWEPGETRELTVENGFTAAAEERPYAIDATVSYTGPTGTTERADPVTVGVTPAAEQAFDLSDHATSLRVGAEGRLTGTFVNEGPGEVENAVLVLEPPANVVTAETEYAVGDLAAGETVDFRYDVDVSSEAREGPRQFTYRLRYEDADGDTVTSDPQFARGTVAGKRDTFSVSTNASLAAGSTGTIEVAVTNDGDERLSTVSAKLFADAPISASNDEAFVESLAPGETATMKFRVSAAGSAIAEPYPVSLDFQYEEPDGDTKISDSYAVGIEVTEGGGGGFLTVFPVDPIAGAGLGLGMVLSLGGLAAVGLGLVGRRE